MTTYTDGHLARNRLIATIPQIDGRIRSVYAQDAQHARAARRVLTDPAMIDHLHGVDGIEIKWTDRKACV